MLLHTWQMLANNSNLNVVLGEVFILSPAASYQSPT